MITQFWRALAWASARQALLGLAVVAASLPLLSALCHTLDFAPPPYTSLLTLGGSVVLGFAGGGAIGAFFSFFSHRIGVPVAFRKLRLLAALLGLIWGFILCTLALPLYLDDVMDDMTDTGTSAAISHADTVLNQPHDVLDQAWAIFGTLAQEGSVRLPALTLLGWTLLGPALIAPLETRPARAKPTRP